MKKAYEELIEEHQNTFSKLMAKMKEANIKKSKELIMNQIKCKNDGVPADKIEDKIFEINNKRNMQLTI
ncbi:hypothetical protein RDV78_08505 [Bacillota bacterium LX-D]|nr:hypothetical protein [Bacillota bacterium LX-D]